MCKYIVLTCIYRTTTLDGDSKLWITTTAETTSCCTLINIHLRTIAINAKHSYRIADAIPEKYRLLVSIIDYREQECIRESTQLPYRV